MCWRSRSKELWRRRKKSENWIRISWFSNSHVVNFCFANITHNSSNKRARRQQMAFSCNNKPFKISLLQLLWISITKKTHTKHNEKLKNIGKLSCSRSVSISLSAQRDFDEALELQLNRRFTQAKRHFLLVIHVIINHRNTIFSSPTLLAARFACAFISLLHRAELKKFINVSYRERVKVFFFWANQVICGEIKLSERERVEWVHPWVIYLCTHAAFGTFSFMKWSKTDMKREKVLYEGNTWAMFVFNIPPRDVIWFLATSIARNLSDKSLSLSLVWMTSRASCFKFQ